MEVSYTVRFNPPSWPGEGPVVNLHLPEGDLQFISRTSIEDPAEVVTSLSAWGRREQINMAYWKAQQHGATLVFWCDTADQARDAKRVVEGMTNGYRHVGLVEIVE